MNVGDAQVHAAWAENKAKVLPPGLLIEPVKPLDYFEVRLLAMASRPQPEAHSLVLTRFTAQASVGSL